jgi:hypothetical protein
MRTYDLFRYDIPHFIKNFWAFRKCLWNFRWYDYSYALKMMETSIKIMADNVETKGIEVDSSRLKKVAKMRRVVEIINNMHGVKHIEMAEKELGSLIIQDWEFVPEGNDLYSFKDNLSEKESKHNKKIYARAREIEAQEWEELWSIMKGQKHSDFRKTKDVDWEDWFDGSGLNTWWD